MMRDLPADLLRVERTRDMEVVRNILAHPAVWPHIHDDGATEPEPIDHEGFIWLLVTAGGPAGCFLFHAHNAVTFEVHTCLTPQMWGPKAREAARLAQIWIFTNTPAQKLVTHVPSYNAVALRFALRCGFTQEGVNRASFLRGGELLDQHLLGLTKKEWQCLPSSP